MSKKSFVTKMISRTLLIIFVSFLCISASFAQDSVAEKMASAKTMFSPSFSSLDDVQRSKVVTFFDNCSKPEKEAILSYMVQAITDSLKADRKEFAINYIDYYRLIADTNNEYLGSLVLTEGKYYYELMDASKLLELKNYINNVAEKAKLDYSGEISELNRMHNEVLNGCQELLGYWVADFSDKEKADPFFVNIYRDDKGKYHIDIDFIGNDLWFYVYSNFSVNRNFYFAETVKALECLPIRPNRLSFYWASEDLKVGKEHLATALRSGVSNISSSIIGEFARSNTYSTATQITGSIGAIIGEAFLNALIDEVSVSKKSIKTITGNIDFVDNDILTISLFVDNFKLRSDNTNIEKGNCRRR